MITLELPYPPSINHYWRHCRGGHFISEEGKGFREVVVGILKAKRVKPMTGELSLLMDLYPPDKRRRDIDNLQKAVMDALQHGGAYADDGQISELSIKRMPVFKGGKAVVQIKPLE